eukprot:6459006-Amphidinium_carterae.1
MDLIEGLENTQDASAYRELLQRYRSNLREFFPRFQEWQGWEIWIQLDEEDLVASDHYRYETSTTQPNVAPSVDGRRTPGLHLHFETVEEVTAETVMLVPLYLLGVFKAWAEQMPWDTLPSRVMDVYKHLHARCGATTLHPSIPAFSFARHTSVVGALRTLKS